MSANADANEHNRGPPLKLHRGNWNTWIAKVKDFILALDHDEAADIWQAYAWVPGDGADPADKDYQAATNGAERKLRTKHNKAFQFIRNALSDEMFDTTLQLDTSVPKLLRHLHKLVVSDGTVSDRDRLRTEYQELCLEDYSDMQAYITAFKNKVHTLRGLGLGLVAEDGDVLYQFNKGLPSTWGNYTTIVSALQMSFNAALAFYLKTAKDDSTLPGNLKKRTKASGAHDSIHNSQEVCRLFAQGRCKRGDNCNYAHPSQPQQSSGGKYQGGDAGDKFKGDCFYCGKPGHRKTECYKKERDDKLKQQGQRDDGAKSHITQEGDDDDAGRGAGKHDDADRVRVDGYAYAVVEMAADVTLSMRAALDSEAHRATSRDDEMWLLMVLDGASTVGVVEDEKFCEQVTDVDLYVKVGGEGKPNFLRCKRTGILPIDTMVDGKRVQMRVPVRIIPGFGCNILPECFFLKKGFAVKKEGAKVVVLTPDKKVVLRGDALKHDNSWLFYAEVQVRHPGSKLPGRSTLPASRPILPARPDYDNVQITFALPVEEGDAEQHALLALTDDYDKCYSTSKLRTSDELQVWHERLGHRNYKDVAAMMGIPLPAKLPTCISCIKGKSKRQPLTGSDGLHEGIRPGYAWVWDHAGPFRVKTWGGAMHLSLKVDVCTGKLAPVMVNSTATSFEEWKFHVLMLEVRFGKAIAARLITDSAPYFFDHKLAQFNEQRGIVHVRSPPYTQELDGLAERTLGTVLAATRTCMDAACAPERAYGECIIAMCEVLDRCPHKTGGKLTRLEKWHDRLLPRQHDKLKAWGCAAYVHLDYGPRGKIGNPGKLEPRAALHMFVGYEKNGMGYRCLELPGFKVRVALHVTFVEDQMPCRTQYSKQLGDFMTVEQRQYYVTGQRDFDIDMEQGEMPIPRGRARERTPSAAALENLAAGDPHPPDDVSLTTEELDNAFAVYSDIVLRSSDCPSNVPSALAGPDGEKWSSALAREYGQHEKNGTFSEAIDPKDLPPGRKAVPFDCVLDIKRDGTRKVRGIIKGYRMTQGLDYNETFAPVPCIGVLRLLLAMAAKFDWEVKQGDVDTAFLCADVDSEVFVAVPNWFCKDATGAETGFTIRRLLKGVPGIPQGSLLFYKKIRGIFTKLELRQCKSEYCLYYCPTRQLYVVVWVDDLFMFFPTQATIGAVALWTAIQGELQLPAWEDIDDCLACTVRRDRPNRTITLSQEPAINKLLLRANAQDANDKDTPMVANIKLSKKQCPSAAQAAVMISEQRWYLSILACIIYFVSWTRPDLAFAVSKLCKFMHNPGREHIVALKRLLRYLKGTASYGLKYDFSTTAPTAGAQLGIYGYYDAAHADCLDTMRSTLAYVFFFCGCPISWHTKLHSVITTSTNHSEYCAAAKAAKEAKWWDKVLTEISFGRFVRPIDLFSDSKGCISMSYNPVQRTASKHVDLADHYAREQQEAGTITITYVSTKDMIADVLTKPLAQADFAKHTKKLVEQI
jgi:hypothetical protein